MTSYRNLYQTCKMFKMYSETTKQQTDLESVDGEAERNMIQLLQGCCS